MRKKHIYTVYKLIASLLIILFLIGCGNTPKKPNSKNTDNSLSKLPKILVSLEDEILNLMFDLDSIPGIEKLITEEKTKEIEDKMKDIDSSKEDKGSSKEDSSEKAGTDEGKDKQDSSESEDKKQDEKDEKEKIKKLIQENNIIIPLLEAKDIKGNFTERPDIPSDMGKLWLKLNDNITVIHEQWNTLQSELVSEKVPPSKTDDFEKALNELTLSVLDKNIFNSLELSNNMTKILADFRSYFDDISNHDIYLMYYHARESILLMNSNNYTKAVENVDEISKIGNSLRQTLNNDSSKESFQKFELSVEALKNQLIERNFHLSQIKSTIVIKNIHLLEDEFKKQKSSNPQS